MADNRNADARVWESFLRPARRGVYEHAATWRKRTSHHTRFASRIRRDPETGCWVWTGLASIVHGHPYPKFAVRDPLTRVGRQRSAFHHMIREHLPEFRHLLGHRTFAGCGNYLCISPLHRERFAATRHVITADQAREVYAAKGTRDATELGRSVGISRYQVLSIWRGESWAHETGAKPHVPRKVMSDETVRAIQSRHGQASARKVAAEFGVGASSVLRVWQGWRQPSDPADLPEKQDA